ncbi:MAG: hypothetical protein PHP54_06140 [Clostridia bacterium]|nr:hypothetical protein [Clostridia bacterium]
MSKTYSKTELKKKRWIKVLITFLLLILVLGIALLVFVGLKKQVNIEKISNVAKERSDEVVEKSTPIIINNLVVGAVYNKEWVASESYYFRNNTKSSTIDLDIYNLTGKKGKFKLTTMTKDAVTGALYAKTDNTNTYDEFIAIASTNNNIMNNAPTKQINITENDINVVKKSLGFLTLFNNSVKITEIYNIVLNMEHRGRIIFVTSEVGKSNGGYSAVIYEDMNKKTTVIKYSFAKDLKNAPEWPIYSFRFTADLNEDGMNEIIIQETKEFKMKYDVIEYKDNKFSEVLSTEIKI